MLFETIQPIAAIALTSTGVQTLLPLREALAITLWVPDAVATQLEPSLRASVQVYITGLKAHLETLWPTHRGLVFCVAAGAVARLIAPLLQDKHTDPAVVVVNESGTFVVSFCGGHQGGADQLTQAIAHWLNATPVITGASAGLGLPAIDTLGKPYGWTKGTGDWTTVSGAIARQEPVLLQQTVGTALWRSNLPPNHPFQSETTAPSARIWIGSTVPDISDKPTVCWHPRVLWVGIGCERGTPRLVIETAIQQVFERHRLAIEAIAGIATLDLKTDEVGLVELCGDRHWPLISFTAAELATIEVPNPSKVVAHEVGTPSVAEAAAMRACQTADWPNASPQLRVAKQIFRLDGQPGAVTVAVAEAQTEHTGRTGQLWLVGTGPGALSQITPAAQAAIAQADVVVGYSLYVDLVRSLLRPGQGVVSLPITQERQRAQQAIALAKWGVTVAVISSGDCGIYGMAGLVLEELRTLKWDGKTPAVQVFPGITALQSVASRLGAPLMHDFCAISLSDLLTPWDVIEKRLHAAAQADFVTALYNPRSRTRTTQTAIARQIFLSYRDPETPVALVRSAYRTDEQIILTTLAQLDDQQIDMLTTVIIGNQSTRRYHDWMITPRGYLGFQPDEVKPS